MYLIVLENKDLFSMLMLRFYNSKSHSGQGHRLMFKNSERRRSQILLLQIIFEYTNLYTVMKTNKSTINLSLTL